MCLLELTVSYQICNNIDISDPDPAIYFTNPDPVMELITWMGLNQSYIPMKTGTNHVILNFKIGTTFKF
jgi:hypothetical protein